MKRKIALAALLIMSTVLSFTGIPVLADDDDRDSDSRYRSEYSDRDDRDGDDDDGDRREVDLRGTVQSLSTGSIVINGQTFVINRYTDIEGRLAVGAVVEVEAVLRDGVLTAREIELKRRAPATTPPPTTAPPPTTPPPTTPPPTTPPPTTPPPTTPPPTTTPPPVVTPPAVAPATSGSVTTTGATLGGNLTSLGTAASVSVRFEYGLTTAYSSATTTQARTTTGAVSAAITGLAQNTLYHFRMVAVGATTVYSADQTFITARALTAPTTTTGAATVVTITGATLNGNLAGLGTAASVSVRFEYGLTTAYGSVTAAQARTATGAVSAAITSLTQNTLYHFRVVAVGDATVYGADQTFTTGRALTAPAVTSNVETSVTTDSGTLNGTLTSLGSAANVSVAFDWGTTTAYGNTTGVQVRTTTGSFSVTLTGLSPGTNYYFRAKATGDGTVLGSVQSFTTDPIPPPAVVAPHGDRGVCSNCHGSKYG